MSSAARSTRFGTGSCLEGPLAARTENPDAAPGQGGHGEEQSIGREGHPRHAVEAPRHRHQTGARKRPEHRANRHPRQPAPFRQSCIGTQQREHQDLGADHQWRRRPHTGDERGQRSTMEPQPICSEVGGNAQEGVHQNADGPYGAPELRFGLSSDGQIILDRGHSSRAIRRTEQGAYHRFIDRVSGREEKRTKTTRVAQGERDRSGCARPGRAHPR